MPAEAQARPRLVGDQSLSLSSQRMKRCCCSQLRAARVDVVTTCCHGMCAYRGSGRSPAEKFRRHVQTAATRHFRTTEQTLRHLAVSCGGEQGALDEAQHVLRRCDRAARDRLEQRALHAALALHEAAAHILQAVLHMHVGSFNKPSPLCEPFHGRVLAPVLSNRLRKPGLLEVCCGDWQADNAICSEVSHLDEGGDLGDLLGLCRVGEDDGLAGIVQALAPGAPRHLPHLAAGQQVAGQARVRLPAHSQWADCLLTRCVSPPLASLPLYEAARSSRLGSKRAG